MLIATTMMTATAAVSESPRSSWNPRRLSRFRLDGAIRDRLFFAQVREDPLLELEALSPAFRGTIAAVSSGGCTALSLLAAGARVVGVDYNRTQNDVVELKVAALSSLRWDEALAFLGATRATGASRLHAYRYVREALSPAARKVWDARAGDVKRGLISAGVTERFVSAVVKAIRLFIHPRKRIDRLLACRSLEEQRDVYHREWNTRRWRALFPILLNRATFSRTYDPAFFQHVENPSFAEHFYQLVEHSLCDVPISTNYFIHQMLTGAYQAEVQGALPPYLTPGGARMVAALRGSLTLVDAPFTTYLRTLPDRSLSGISLSNICEWLAPEEVDALFAEVVRTAEPGAVVCFRNFVSWTEIPLRWRRRVVEDRARGEEMSARDRSVVQPRFAVCRVVH